MKQADTTTTPQSKQTPLDVIGGEPLEGSGFEQEAPERGFSDKQTDQQ